METKPGETAIVDFSSIVKRIVDKDKILSEMLDALYIALPYVETALEDQGYDKSVVHKVCRQIRNAIASGESLETKPNRE